MTTFFIFLCLQFPSNTLKFDLIARVQTPFAKGVKANQFSETTTTKQHHKMLLVLF